MGDIARLLSFESFEPKPLTIKFEHAVLQNKVLLEQRLKQYLAYRCGFNEIFTYPWIDEKYINAASIDKDNSVKLATPPSPSEAYLRSSLVPGMLEAISKNLRYYNDFRLFEMAQVFEKGEYHESCEEETLPIHKKLLTATIVGRDASKVFYELKGVLESMSSYCHMESITFKKGEKPTYGDVNVHLNIMLNGKIIGNLCLLSIKTMSLSKIKRANVALFELNVDELIPLSSRENKFEHIPLLPLVEKDLSIIVSDDITWEEISNSIKGKVKEVKFIEEYRGEQISKGMKSIMLRVIIDNVDTTMTSEEINSKLESILKTLNKKCGATLREE